MADAENGFLQPNPALFDLEERRKKKKSLAHELGEGAQCRICLGKCPGFQLHYWRKVCSNCRCGKAEHNVQDSEIDPGTYFVGKIFDRPLRSLQEELEFCYGRFSPSEVVDRSSRPSRNNGNDSGNESIKTDDEDEEGRKSGKDEKKKVLLDWVPPNVAGSKNLVTKYLKSLPYVPIAGTSGAIHRKQQLQKQFPVHDIEPNKCHDLTSIEINTMKDYVSHVKENNVGQGLVLEVQDDDVDDLPLPPPPIENLTLSGDDSSDFLPPPPPSLLANKPSKAPDTFFARPVSPPRNQAVTEKSKINLPPITGGICDGCKNAFTPGDVVIRADRADPGQLWHPNCFKCSVCKELLVDLLYYYDNGRLYCGRDFAVIVSKIPRCGACDELIFASEYTGAEDQVFHLKHFCCFECDRPLAGHKYISVDNQPHCFLCYQAKHGKVCKTCGKYINPGDQRLSLDNDHWHATNECFLCGVCGKSLVGGKMTRKDEYILCSSACKMKLIQEESPQRGVIV